MYPKWPTGFLHILLALFYHFTLLSGEGNQNHAVSKRSLLFPRNTVLQMTVGLSVPLVLPSRTIILSLCAQANYELPNNLTQLRPRIVQAKSNQGLDLSRETFYKYLIGFLSGLGLDGEQCLYRAICEISEYPMYLNATESLLEEIVHFIFTPSLELEANNRTEGFASNLLHAEEVGRRNGKCGREFPGCLFPIADIFTSRYII